MNGKVSFESLTFRSKLEFECDDGYFLNSKEPVFCSSDGTWDKTDVQCIAAACDRPEHPENGQVIFSSLNFGSELKFRCDDGYVLKQNGPVVCTLDGTWNRTDVQCVAKTCDYPEHPDNGQVTFTSLNFGSQLKFKCDGGYLLKPNEPVFCTSNGTWNGTDVRCVAISKDNGKQSDSAHFEGIESVAATDQPIVYVSEGLKESNGTEDITDGDISTYPSTNVETPKSTEPTVIKPEKIQDKKCGPPPKVEGTLELNLDSPEAAIGTSITYRCEFGYVNQDSKALRSSCQWNADSRSAAWTKPDVVCIPRSCGEPGFVSNAHRIGNLFTFPNKVEFQCQEGYKLKGPAVRYCQASGTWSGRLPKCDQINCAPPANPEHGRVRYSSLEYGTELRYECDRRFVLSQHEKRTCTADGTWSNTEPVCIEGSCEMPLAPKNGNVQMAGAPKAGTLALYSCKEGRTMVGPSASKCLITGEWTFPPPKCVSPCVLSVIPNGDVGYMESRRVSRYKSEEWFVKFQVGKSFKDEETAIFRCRDGFEPVESAEGWSRSGEVVTCKDGQWSKSLECKPESCYGEPPSVDNGYPVVNNRAHGVGINYHCDNYYLKTGKDDVKCSYGQWTGKTPKCIDSRCYVSQLNYPGLEKPPVHFIEHGKNYIATCIKGYKVSRDGIKVLCNAGKWTIPAAICVEASCDGEPPSMDNGFPVVDSRSHGYGIYYTCVKYYVKSEKGQVKCSYGQWTGHTPTCIDGRCYVSQLNHRGLEKPPVDFIEHGKDYPATCMQGFKAINQWKKISCNAGKWNISANICVEVRCYVSQLNHRGLEKPPVDFIEDGQDYPATCMEGFKAINDWKKISCNAGKWNIPADICVEVDEVTTPVSPKAKERVSRKPENCFCIFNSRSQHLAAVTNKQQLEYGGPVKKGDAALLSCTDGRLHLLWPNGMRTLDAKMTCEACEVWESNDLPSCEPTHPGDSFIVLNQNVKVQPGGAVESRISRDLKIECISWNTNYPDWRAPMTLPVNSKAERMDAWNTFYQSFIHIQNVGQQHVGSYECSARSPRSPHHSLRATKLDLIIACHGEPHGIDYGTYNIQSRSHKSRVEYECDDGYEMTGPYTVQCLHGKWLGQPPQCVKAIPEASVSSVGQEGTYTGTSNNSAPKPIASKEPSLGGEDDCFCTYNNPDRLVSAMYFRERLFYGDKVDKGRWTQLKCVDQAMHLVLPNGTEITTGTAKLTCSVCETWEVDQLPTCETIYHPGLTCPQIVITNDIEVKYSDGRRVGSTATFCCIDSSLVLVGQSFKCLQNGTWDINQKPYCQRTSVSEKHASNTPASKESKSEEDCVCTYTGNWRLKTLFNGERIWRGKNIKKGESIQLGCVDEGKRLVLSNGTMIMSGSITWTCNRCGSWEASEMPTCEEIQLPAVTCPQFNITEGTTVKYTNERRVGSTATFSCTAPYVRYGPSTLLCLQTGVWNNIQSSCQKPEVICPPIPDTDVFSVQYNNGRKINSTAYFRCKDANLKIVGNLDTRTCLESGEWSGANPDCEAPGCLIGDFGETAPINLLPSMEGVTKDLQPVGSELAMHCEEGWVLIEDKMATCGRLGKWNFGKARCVVGCQLNIKDEYSPLIITPEKEYYRFGQSVTLSCSEGFELTSDVERVLCMENGWTDTIPNCKEKTKILSKD